MTEQKRKIRTVIIGRTNPVVCTAGFDLIKAGCAVQIMGKDIASDLKEVIGDVLGRKTFRTSLDEFLISLEGWIKEIRETCIDPETKEAYEEKADFLSECEESNDTLKVISERIVPKENEERNVQLLIDKINTYFIESDDVNPDAIVCGTGHKVKGLEYERAVILRMDLCPHPKAEGEEELFQEENIKYVMLSRAIEEMWVCFDKKPE